MQTLWPWLAVAGLGALHGLSPANGWMFAAAWGVRGRDSASVRRALVPIAIGHAASIAIVVGVVAQGIWMDRVLVQRLAGALLIGVAAYRALRGAGQRTTCHRVDNIGSQAGLALWSCLMTTAHGAGLMLVPALVPLCMSELPAREITASGSLVLALVAVGVHLAAMLGTTVVIAAGVCRGITLHSRLLPDTALNRGWAVALAVTGALLMTIR